MAFSLIEVMVGLCLLYVFLMIAIQFLTWSSRSAQKSIEPQADLQMASRRALLELMKELQESIEFVRPPQGATLTYFVARDRTNALLTGYLAESPRPAATGEKLFDFYLHRHEPGAGGPVLGQRKLLSNVRKMTFTGLSPGTVQIHAEIVEAGKPYVLLTTVRARNIASEAEL